MACVVEKLASNLNKEVTSRAVWDHLSTMYDLKKLVSIYFFFNVILFFHFSIFS